MKEEYSFPRSTETAERETIAQRSRGADAATLGGPILSAVNDAEIALCGKGYPDARASIVCQRTRYTPGRPWTATLYLGTTIEAYFIRGYSDAQAAVWGLSLAVEEVEAKPREWTEAEVMATLGVVEYAQAAE